MTLSDLKPDRRNANRGTVRGRALLEDSLRRYGAGRSILADKHGNIIAGNKTLEASVDIGLPVRFVESDGTELVVVQRTDLDLDTEQARSLAYLDNRVAELDLDWDVAALLEDRDNGLDLAAVGFTDDELAALLAGVDTGTEGLTDPDAVPAVPEVPVTQPGDLWLLGRHRLLCGDATVPADVARLLAGVVPDCIVTDPPYCSGGFQEAGRSAGSIGTDAKIKPSIANDRLSTRGYMALMKSVLSLAQAPMAYIFTDWRMWVNLFDVAESSGYGVRSMVVWDKGSPGMGMGWRSQHELVMFAVKAVVKFDGHKAQGNVIPWSRTGNPLHPTQKPVEVLQKLLDVADMAHTLYDPFAGSGSTLFAAETMGWRDVFMMELDRGFCDVICRRFYEFSGIDPVRESDGAKWSEVAP